MVDGGVGVVGAGAVVRAAVDGDAGAGASVVAFAGAVEVVVARAGAAVWTDVDFLFPPEMAVAMTTITTSAATGRNHRRR